MHIQLETRELHSIQSYSETGVTINQKTYHSSFILNKDTLITDWDISNPTLLTQALLEPICKLEPEIIILGSHAPQELLKIECIRTLQMQSIGVECMERGPASRTFNLLLSEQRNVALGMILNG